MKTVKMSHTQVSRKFHQMNLIKRKFHLPWCQFHLVPGIQFTVCSQFDSTFSWIYSYAKPYLFIYSPSIRAKSAEQSGESEKS